MGISVIENHINGINFANEFCCAIFTIVILAALLFKKHHNTEIRGLLYFCFCSATAMWTDTICYMCGGNKNMIGLMYLMTVISYAFTTFATCTFYAYIMAYFEERSNLHYHPLLKIGAYVYSLVCTAIYASSVWTEKFFYIDSQSRYQATADAHIIGVIELPLVLASVFIIIKNRKLTSKRDTVIHLLYNLTYVILGYFDAVYTVSFHYIVMTIFVIIIFIFINQERDKELETKHKELAISELNALRLQMNPHFVYNTLASIDGLVDVDPNSAKDLIAKFTKHLRSSYLNNSPAFVDFAHELENIKCYLSVEEVRFPDINIEYDLRTTDFKVPPLTIQPLVENAIKHGICKTEDGSGTITIASFEDDKNYYVKITDNGVGFDTNAPVKKDGRSHVGIANTEKRLKLICNGSLMISGKPGEGTQALITIPKEKV